MIAERSVAGAGRRGRIACAATLVAACLLSVQAAAIGAVTAPVDYFYAAQAQWGFDRIKTLSAWNVSRGNGVTVALVDTGVDMDHVDLKGQIASGGTDYIDHGAPNDNQGHGTLMAGIVAARTNNKDATGAGVGLAAIAPDAKVLPIRWVQREGSGLSGKPADAAAGIRSAIGRAKVIVLGWDWPGNQGSMPDVREVYADGAVESAIKDASDAGAVVVLAAGNNGESSPAYNPHLPGVIVVGATTQQDGLPAGANGGADILAPGHNIVSTYWDPKGSFPCPQHAAQCPDNQRKYESIYAVGEGTSLAAAHVAGVAALMVSKGGMSNAEIVERLISSGEQLGSSKLLDAAAALGTAVVPVTPPPPPPPSGGPGPVVVNPSGASSPSAPPSSPSTKAPAPPTPGRTTKPKAAQTTKPPVSQAIPAAPASPTATAPATPEPAGSPSSVTTDTTPSQGSGSVSSVRVPLDRPATFLASGLNLVAGAIDYTGGLVKQVGLWQGIAGLGALVVAFEGSRWIVRRKQERDAR